MGRVRAYVVLLVVFLAPAAARADVVRLGELSPFDPPPGERSGCPTIGALYIPGLDGGRAAPPPGAPRWTVPEGGGVITSWSFNNAAAGARVRLAVTRFVKFDAAVVDARSAVETIKVTDDVNTFPASIPVRGGEQISLDVPISDDAPTPRVCYWGRNVSEEFAYEADGTRPTGEETPLVYSYGYEKTRVNITATIDTSGGGGTTPTSPPPSNPVDTTAPRLSGLRMRSHLPVGHGASIRYSASEPATALLLVQRLTNGRWRYLKGGLTHSATAGRNVFRWDGKLDKRHLRLGRYRLAMILKDAGGNSSRPARAAFRVVKRR